MRVSREVVDYFNNPFDQRSAREAKSSKKVKKLDVVTNNGLNLSDWEVCQKQLPKDLSGRLVTFGEHMRKTDPEGWEKLIDMAVDELDRNFEFLHEWMLDIPSVMDKACTLLAGGIIAQYNFDYRIAGVLAAQALTRTSDARDT